MVSNFLFFKFLLSFVWIHLEEGYLCHTLSVISNGLFFNRPWLIYNTEWCRLFFFLNFLWTFLWMHLVGYLCHTSFFPIAWCLAAAVKAVLSLLSSFRFLHFTQLIITCFGQGVFSLSLHVDFVLFAIDSNLTCSSYSFIICGAYDHLFWWSCIFRVSSCWFCMVCNWLLSHLFLIFLYHLRMALFRHLITFKANLYSLQKHFLFDNCGF